MAKTTQTYGKCVECGEPTDCRVTKYNEHFSDAYCETCQFEIITEVKTRKVYRDKATNHR